MALAAEHPEAAAVFAAAVAELPMSAQSVECMSAMVGGVHVSRGGCCWMCRRCFLLLLLLPLLPPLPSTLLTALAPNSPATWPPPMVCALPFFLQVGRAQLPDWVLTTFLANCMQDTSACQVRQGVHSFRGDACVAAA